jgi:CubicO group peptidase (beta-lactamase class C family)
MTPRSDRSQPAVHRLPGIARWAVWVLVVGVMGCRAPQPSPPPALSSVFRSEKLALIDGAISQSIASNRCPGGVFWLERNGVVYAKAYGHRAVEPSRETTSPDTIYDAASLTKVLATAPAVALLIELGRIDPEKPLAQYLPAFAAHGKEAITVRQVLTHTSGLRPGLGGGSWSGSDRALELACDETPTHPPDTRFVYSDINFILMGKLVEVVSGQTLDAFCEARLYRPLKMRDTGYRPLQRGAVVDRIAPTERRADGSCFRGEVHDPTARKMGGVAGHAGLFTTASDVARFCRMMDAGGTLEGVRVFRPETVDRMISVQTPAHLPKRGLGWDIDSPYAGPRGSIFPVGSFGHSGWTGTSLWQDPGTHTWVIFLSNRNHPTEEGNVLALRRQLGTLAAESLVGVEFGGLR